MTHYDTLGVAPDASASDIKAAFRKAASAAHPDREGGSTERMAAVNRAWDTLGDEAKRAAYDAAGHQEVGAAPTIEQEARQHFVQMIGAALDHAQPVLHSIREFIGNAKDNAVRARQELTTKQERMRKFKATTRVKDGRENVLHGVMDAQLADVDRNLTALARTEQMIGLIEGFLTHYEEDQPPPLLKVDQARLQDEFARMVRNSTFSTGAAGWNF